MTPKINLINPTNHDYLQDRGLDWMLDDAEKLDLSDITDGHRPVSWADENLTLLSNALDILPDPPERMSGMIHPEAMAVADLDNEGDEFAFNTRPPIHE